MDRNRIEPIVKRFYDGVADGHYWGRRCKECGAVEFPPHLMCNACGGRETEWVELTGHGRLLSFVSPCSSTRAPCTRSSCTASPRSSAPA